MVVAVWHWVQWCRGQLVHMFNYIPTAVAIFQVGKGRDTCIQVCAKALWLLCAEFDIMLGVSHTPIENLTLMADALKHWHMDQLYNDDVNQLVQDRRIELKRKS